MIRAGCEPILLIRSPQAGETRLIEYFKSVQQPWVEVCKFVEAEQLRSGGCFGLIVCDWELFQLSQSDQEECQNCKDLLRAAASLIFISARQSVAVNFKALMGRCFYCLKEIESCGLFEVIAELATQVPATDDDSNWPEMAPEAVRRPALGSPTVPQPDLPAPHFPLNQTISPTLANSSVHAMY